MRPPADVNDPAYAERLDRLGRRWWKRMLDVQRPYRWYLQRLKLGFVLDVGCGVGRSLLNSGGHGVGVDLNAKAVELTRARGLEAYLADDFLKSRHARPETFDTLLLAHVLEHMSKAAAADLLRRYQPYLKRGGRVVLIAPQEAGYASDPTHVAYLDFAALEDILRAAELEPVSRRSFPLPRPAGRIFPYNEFVVLGRKP